MQNLLTPGFMQEQAEKERQGGCFSVGERGELQFEPPELKDVFKKYVSPKMRFREVIPDKDLLLASAQ